MFRQNILDQLNDLSDRNPSQYWNLIKQLKELDADSPSSKTYVSPEEWLNHFSKLLYSSNLENCTNLEKNY